MAELWKVVHVLGTASGTRGEAARCTWSEGAILLRMGGMPERRARIQCKVTHQLLIIITTATLFIIHFLQNHIQIKNKQLKFIQQVRIFN